MGGKRARFVCFTHGTNKECFLILTQTSHRTYSKNNRLTSQKSQNTSLVLQSPGTEAITASNVYIMQLYGYVSTVMITVCHPRVQRRLTLRAFKGTVLFFLKVL